MESNADDLTLRDYLAPVFARKWMILAFAVVVAGAVYAYSSQQNKVYKTSTRLYTAQEADPILGTGGSFNDDRTLENQATLLTSQDVAIAVKKAISFGGTAESLANRVTASRRPQVLTSSPSRLGGEPRKNPRTSQTASPRRSFRFGAPHSATARHRS